MKIKLYLIYFFSFTLFAKVPFLESSKKLIIETKKLSIQSYPNAFNPSIIKKENGYLLSFRHFPSRIKNPDFSYIGLVFLNESFEPISEPKLVYKAASFEKTLVRGEDPRLIEFSGKTYIIYNDAVEKKGLEFDEYRDMFFGELIEKEGNYFLKPVLLTPPKYLQDQPIQKNWSLFGTKEDLLISFCLNPHIVLFLDKKNGLCPQYVMTKSAINWNYGHMRGSCSPILIDGQYLGFFHSKKWTSSNFTEGQTLWHYFIGAYTFSKNFPFEIKKISSKPIVEESFYSLYDPEKLVIFPGGFVDKKDFIVMVYGKNDSEVWIAKIDKKELFKSLIPVKAKKIDYKFYDT